MGVARIKFCVSIFIAGLSIWILTVSGHDGAVVEGLVVRFGSSDGIPRVHVLLSGIVGDKVRSSWTTTAQRGDFSFSGCSGGCL